MLICFQKAKGANGGGDGVLLDSAVVPEAILQISQGFFVMEPRRLGGELR